jgi:hypothetical protein
VPGRGLEHRGEDERPALPPQAALEQVLAFVRAGAFPWVAAQAADIGPQALQRLFAWAEEPDPACPPPKRLLAFARDLERAQAEARAAAEIEVRRADPFRWLRFGPGRAAAGEPGWQNDSVLDQPRLRVELVWPEQQGQDES